MASVLLKKSEVNEAAELLTRAFGEDLFYKSLFTDESRRWQQMKSMFVFRLNYGLRYGVVMRNSGELAGVSVWMPSENLPMSLGRIVLCGGLVFALKAGQKVMKRLEIIGRETADQFDLEVPHWHLGPLGVNPDDQGKGIGSLLISDMMSRADREGTPIVLETQGVANVRFYEHHGFMIKSCIHLSEVNLDSWSMIRIPGLIVKITQNERVKDLLENY